MTATRPPGYDDRSAAPVEASRRGAHRARPKAIAAVLPVVAGVAVVLLVIGAVYTVFGNRADDAPSGNAAPIAEGGAEPSAAPSSAGDAPKDEDKGDKGADDQGTEKTPAAEESADEDAGAGGGNDAGGSEVDKSIEVVVLNSIGVSGLAAQYEVDLEGKGWTVKRTGNSTNRDLPVTKIYYAGAEMKPSADAVRKAIGVGEISDSPEVSQSDITVVLGEDTQ